MLPTLGVRHRLAVPIALLLSLGWATGASAAIARQETVTAASTASPTTLPSIQGGTSQTYVLFIATDPANVVSAVSGGGLTWTLQKDQCGAKLVTAERVWTAQGSPGSAFQVQITYGGGSGELAAVLSRYSGVASVTGAAGENTNGPGGSCGTGPANGNVQLTLTSTQANAVFTIGVAPNAENVVSFKSGYAAVGSQSAGSSSKIQNTYVYDRTFASPTTDQFTATTDIGKAKWATAGIVLVPTVVVGPNLTFALSVNPSTSSPPGTDLAYTTTFTNSGTAPAQTVVITDPVPAYTDFKVGSETHNLGTTGLTVVVAYSNDGGSTWTYTPVSGAGGAPVGYDRLVTNIRWTFSGSLSQTAPNNTGTAGATMRIR